MSKKNEKKLSFSSYDEVFGKDFQSEKFQKSYSEELARLKLARQIRELRIRRKLTQRDVSEKTHMPQSVIARIESGTHSYSLGTLWRLARAFNKEVRLA